MRKLNKRGNITLYVISIVLALFLVAIAAFAAPMGVLFNSEMYQAGELIMAQANESIAGIDDVEVRNRVLGLVNNSFEAQENNIAINNSMFQYSWIIVLIVMFIVIFLYARTLVETRGGGGFI